MTGVLLVFAGLVVRAIWAGAVARGEVGYDVGLYVRIAERWLDTGHLYYPIQFAGPYPDQGDINLYPPLALYLFVPFVALPRLLWWLIPLGVVAAVLVHHRPPAWTWPLLALVAATVPFGAMLAYGNTGLWVLAIVALATIRPAFAVLLAFKPSVFPLAVLFAYRRSWWLAAALVGIAALPFWGFWVQWLAAAANLEGSAVLYSINTAPMIAALILAWLTGRQAPFRATRASVTTSIQEATTQTVTRS